MSNLDDMIESMFPGQSARAPQPVLSAQQVGSSSNNNRVAADNDWDSPVRKPGTSNSVGVSRSDVVVVAKASTVSSGTAAAARSSFDDSSDDESSTPIPTGSGGGGAQWQGSGGVTNHSVSAVHTVPFPSLDTQHLIGACLHSCVVSSTSNRHLHHPTVEELRSMHQVVDIHTPTQQVMRRKGAFHAYADLTAGNGVGEGGCTHIVCRRCDHPVVRLHGAGWMDDNGKNDLYLLMRNFYPDWHRLALAVDHTGAPVLVSMANTAAYCCQCSWLTVHDATVTITTTSVDILQFKQINENTTKRPQRHFVTHVPDAASSREATSRAPLWECRGHGVIGGKS